MKKQQDLLHTPEGVRDIYDLECEQKLVIEEHLFSTMKSFGYRPIETPSFEFFDVFTQWADVFIVVNNFTCVDTN